MPKGIYKHKPLSVETKTKISNTHKRMGIKPIPAPWTIERRRKLSKSMSNKTPWNKGLSKDTSIILKNQGLNHSLKMKGIKWSQEIINKRRILLIGRKRAEWEKIKISIGRQGIKFSEQHKNNISKSLTGEKNGNWLGGITPKSAGRLNKKGWKDIRLKVLIRDNYTCQFCGREGNNVHHIIPYRICEHNNINNLTTLCRPCHRKEDASIASKGEKRGSIKYEDFLEKYK